MEAGENFEKESGGTLRRSWTPSIFSENVLDGHRRDG